MNAAHRRTAREQYMEALLAVEAGHRRRPWPSVAILSIGWMLAVGIVMTWLWLVWETGAFIGSSLARLIQHGGLLQ